MRPPSSSRHEHFPCAHRIAGLRRVRLEATVVAALAVAARLRSMVVCRSLPRRSDAP